MPRRPSSRRARIASSMRSEERRVGTECRARSCLSDWSSDVCSSDLLFRRGGYISEVELRYEFASQPGKLRVTAWLHNTFSGSYREAVELTLANPGLDATTAIEQTRTDRIKYEIGRASGRDRV